MFFNQFLVSFADYPVRNTGGLFKIDSVRWAFPVLLDWNILMNSHKGYDGRSCLECFSQHCGLVEVFREVEDMGENIFCCLLEAHWLFHLLYLLHGEPKDVLKLCET